MISPADIPFLTTNTLASRAVRLQREADQEMGRATAAAARHRQGEIAIGPSTWEEIAESHHCMANARLRAVRRYLVEIARRGNAS